MPPSFMVGPLYIGFLLVNDLFLLIFLLIIFFIFNTSHVLESTAFNFVKNNLSFSIFSFSVWIMQPLNTSKEEKRSNSSKKSNLYEFYIFLHHWDFATRWCVNILSYLIRVKTWLIKWNLHYHRCPHLPYYTIFSLVFHY